MFSNSAHTDSAVDSAECFFVVDRLCRMCSDSIRSNSFWSLHSDRINLSSESQPELVCCGDIHHHQKFEPRIIWFLVPASCSTSASSSLSGIQTVRFQISHSMSAIVVLLSLFSHLFLSPPHERKIWHCMSQ